MKTVPLTPERETDCVRFLKRCSGSLFYQSAGYRRLLTELLGCRDDSLVAIDATGEIRGILPLMSCGDDSGRVFNSLPYFGSNGDITSETVAAREALETAYRDLLVQPGTLASTIVENPFSRTAASDPPHDLLDERIAQFTRLPEGEGVRERILAACEGSCRRNVRKAERQGFRVVTDASRLPTLYEVHRENIEAIGGRPKTPWFFELVAEYFVEGRDFDLVTVLDGETFAAGVLIFYFHETVEYFTPAVRAEYRSGQPLSLALITAMTDAARCGFRVWNWGGTWRSQTGVYRFKRKWNAEEARYRYFTKVNDDTLLDRRPEELLERFPEFFVVPFGALRKEAA